MSSSEDNSEDWIEISTEEKEELWARGVRDERLLDLKKVRKDVLEWIKTVTGDVQMSRFFREKINEIEEQIKEEKSFLNERFKKREEAKSSGKVWYYDWSIEKTNERIKELERKLRKFDYYYKLTRGKISPSKDIDVERIKVEVLIGDLLPEQLRSSWNKRVFFKCPLHNESTPSFCWYVKDNRFKCFGCGEYGSVIDLYMKLNNVNFKEAINYLNTLI